MKVNIRSVLFDADGVVQKPSEHWLSCLENLIEDKSRVEDFVADIFSAEKPCVTGSEDFPTNLGRVLDKWNCAANIDEVLAIWTMIDTSVEMLGLISEVRESGRRVALATNQQHFRAEFMKHQLRYAHSFDDLFFSCEIGLAKPDPAFFSHLCEVMRLPAAEVLFFDDHADNVKGARSIGMNAEVYDLQQGLPTMYRLLERYSIVPVGEAVGLNESAISPGPGRGDKIKPNE